MNGAESLIRTAVGAGIEVCFANPGTTEMPLVAALDAVPGIRSAPSIRSCGMRTSLRKTSLNSASPVIW